MSLEFEGASVWSHEWQSQRVEIGRVVRNPRGQWVVLVKKERVRDLARRWRVDIIQRRAKHAQLAWVHVEQFEDHLANQRWYTERVACLYGMWKRARAPWSKSWKFGRLVAIVQDRARFERLFRLKHTKEESDVRTARVVQALLGNG